MNLTLVLTHQCNLACPYCYAGEKENRRMSWETARAGLDMAFDGPARGVDLAFFGGEPLLEFPLLQRATAYARERSRETGKRLRPLVTTNGTCLTEERLDWLLAEDFFLGFSMDGGPEATARSRPFKSGRSSFDAVQRGLDRLMASGHRGYEVMLVVDPETIGFLPESLDYLVSRGVRRLSLNPNFFTPWSETQREQWRRGYHHAATLFRDAYRGGDPLYVNFLDSKIITAVKGGFAPSDRCSFGEGELAVAPSGNLYPCERLVGDDRDPTWVLGNVLSGGLESARVCQAGSSCGNVEEECLSCPLQDRCMNWCGCSNYLETGAADRVGGNLCWHEKMAIPLADAVARDLYEEQNPHFLKRFYFEDASPEVPPALERMAV